MRKMYAVILTGCLFLFAFSTNAQSSFDSAGYRMQFTFTGEVLNEWDSVFEVSLELLLPDSCSSEDIDKIYIGTTNPDKDTAYTLDSPMLFEKNSLAVEESRPVIYIGKNKPPHGNINIHKVIIEDKNGRKSTPLTIKPIHEKK